MELEEVEDKIGSITVLIADLKLTKGAGLGLNCGCVISIVFKALEFSAKL